VQQLVGLYVAYFELEKVLCLMAGAAHFVMSAKNQNGDDNQSCEYYTSRCEPKPSTCDAVRKQGTSRQDDGTRFAQSTWLISKNKKFGSTN